MTISYVGEQHTSNGGTGADLVVATPAGVVAGDWLFLVAAQADNLGYLFPADDFGGADGWRIFGDGIQHMAPAEAILIYRRAAAGDPTSWTITGVQNNGAFAEAMIVAYHTDNPRGLAIDAWQLGSYSPTFGAVPDSAWYALATTTRDDDTVIVLQANRSAGAAVTNYPAGFTVRASTGSLSAGDKAETNVGQFRYDAAMSGSYQWTAAAISLHERDTPPANNNFVDAIELDLVGQRRRVRSLQATTNGATIEAGENASQFSNTGTVTNTVWFKLTADAGTTGPFRIAIPSAGEDYDHRRQALYTAAVLWRQRGAGFAGLQYIDDSTNRRDDGLHNNCEGYAQGRDNYMWEFALGGGEVYYIQVATYTNVDSADADFTLEWCYDPVDEPVILTGPKVPSACPGTPLPTHGWNIAYYDAIYGFPARFVAGRRMQNTPDLPADGHAFYVEDVREFAQLHIRRLIIGWTPAFGPFFYGYLDPHGWLRTWTVDNEDPNGVGAADMVGGVHQGIVFYDMPTRAAATNTVRSVPGEGSTDPTESWGAPIVDGTGDMAWGGPGRPGSIFAAVFPQVGSAYTVEWDLAGNVLQTIPLRAFQWCSLDGTELFGILDPQLKAYNLATGTQRVIASSGYAYNQDIYGVRSTNGHIVMNDGAVFGIDKVAVVDPATGSRVLYDPPTVSSISTWASTNRRRWNPFGVTADGKHLFFGLFYPLTSPFVGTIGSRDFVTDMWWMDLDTGECERKFMLAHPFHDTFFVPDVEPPVPTSNVRGVRLYKQADVG